MKTECAGCNVVMLEGRLSVAVSILREKYYGTVPRIGVLFRCGNQTRRLPLLPDSYNAEDGKPLQFSNRFILSEVFYHFKAGETAVDIILENGEKLPVTKECINANIKADVKTENGSLVISAKLMQKKTRRSLAELKRKPFLLSPFVFFLNLYFSLYKKRHPVKNNRVTFISGRRIGLSGNMKFVYDELKGRSGLELKTLLYQQTSGYQLLAQLKAFMLLYATSKVIVVDDYVRLLNIFEKPEQTKVVQLWHACGAFKTFGYSRLGKPGGPSQRDKNHRMYDLAFVSSSEIARHYAEGFGISDSCVAATGIPRCDVFFDKAYKEKTRKVLYQKYPMLKGKKVVLFAPTFRGNGQQSAYYPVDKLDVNRLSAALGNDTAVIIKLHPFCKETFAVDEKRKTHILNLSNEDELNDLLFITDLLITDYSSAVFEASLLNIPMLFYAFDLKEYIGERDFYYDFKGFAPGRIVSNEDELIQCIKEGNFEQDKLDGFKNKFFNFLDSGSSKRAAERILDEAEVNYER